MIVIDASIANKLFLPHEEGHQKVKSIFQKHIEKKVDLIVPELLFYEVANTLATKTSIPISQVMRSLAHLYIIKLHVEHLSEKSIIESARLAKKYKTSVYDAAYMILATEKKCQLITADKKFVQKINLPFIILLDEYS